MTSYFMRIENACSEEKDLGITFDSNLNFKTHMNKITKKEKHLHL